MLDVRAIVTGLVILAIAMGLVFWKGERLVRTTAACGAVCWIGAAIGQFLTGSAAGPIILSDVAFAGCLLVLIFRHHRPWLYGLFAVEAARLILHGMVYEQQISPSPLYRLSNNILSTLALLVMVAVALRRRRTPQPA